MRVHVERTMTCVLAQAHQPLTPAESMNSMPSRSSTISCVSAGRLASTRARPRPRRRRRAPQTDCGRTPTSPTTTSAAGVSLPVLPRFRGDGNPDVRRTQRGQKNTTIVGPAPQWSGLRASPQLLPVAFAAAPLSPKSDLPLSWSGLLRPVEFADSGSAPQWSGLRPEEFAELLSASPNGPQWSGLRPVEFAAAPRGCEAAERRHVRGSNGVSIWGHRQLDAVRRDSERAVLVGEGSDPRGAKTSWPASRSVATVSPGGLQRQEARAHDEVRPMDAQPLAR